VAEVESAALSGREALSEPLIDGLGRLVKSDGVMITGFDARTGRVVTSASDPRVSDLRDREPELWAACLRHHPTVVEYGRTGDGAPLRFSDLLSVRAYRRLPIYQQFFRPCGVEYKLDVRVWPTRHTVDLGCFRQHRDFDEQDRATLNALRPYLTTILRRSISKAPAEHLRTIFGLTPREADVLALVVRGRRPSEVACELVLAEGTVRKHIERIYVKLGVTSRTQAIARVLEPAAVAPNARHRVREILSELDVRDPTALYALTAREIEVLTLAATGASNAVIATQIGARPETVKKHLDHIYTKLGVASRAQAATRALALGLVSK
jgi:DNA-binding NarL/FixJ family response regulator